MFGQNIPLGFTGGAAEPAIADFLLIAGGGGSRANFNKVTGAGGGGYRTSWSGGSGVSGGGSNLEPQLSLEPGVTYTITVAGGGNAINDANGGNSSIIGGGTINISCTGGGGGNAIPAKSGGSGGGGYYTQNTSIRPGGSGTSGEGYSGGRGRNYSSGGGGGAGSAGSNGTEGGNNNSRGGNGGNGLYNTITGSSIGYAGGTAGSGDGLGFGTTPVDFGASLNGTARVNSGGALSKNASQAAGSGFCVLRIPTSSYTGTTTGSPTVATDGTDTILKYTGNKLLKIIT